MSSKKLVSGLIYLLVIPLVCFGGIMFFRERFYSFVTAALAILTVAGYFLHFEKKHSNSTACDNSRHDCIVRFRQDSFQLSAGL